MNKLLINEQPLIVLPSLAEAIGLNEAIILQQIHFWLGISKNERYGLIWVYKTYSEWCDEFPFWSQDTIERAMLKLESAGIVVSCSWFNKHPMDKTKWYTIDYSVLDILEEIILQSRSPQNAVIDGGNLRQSHHRKVRASNQRHKITSETPAGDGEKKIRKARPRDLIYEAVYWGLTGQEYESGVSQHNGLANAITAECKKSGVSSQAVRDYYESIRDQGLTITTDKYKVAEGARRLMADSEAPNDPGSRPIMVQVGGE